MSYKVKVVNGDLELTMDVEKRGHAKILKDNLEKVGCTVEVVQEKPVIFK